MKRKSISLILAVIMAVGMIPVAAITAFAEEQEPETEYLSETIVFSNSSTAESEHFILTAVRYDKYGWCGGGSAEIITIAPKSSNNLLIRNIEAVVSCFGDHYSSVGVSSGTKREPGNMDSNRVVHIDGVNDYSFSFADGSNYSQFKDITVFYEVHTHTPVLHPEREATETEHGYTTAHYYCEKCGKYFSDAQCENEIIKATVESYIIHHWSDWAKGDHAGHNRSCTCTGCGAAQREAHTGYSEDCVCDVCEYAGVFAETIAFYNSTTAESEHFTLTAETYDSDGWNGGGDDNTTITITPKNGANLLIRNIEAVIGYYGNNYAVVGISSGTKREPGTVKNGTTVHVDNVDDYSFSFAGGDNYSQFKDITVFYELHSHVLTLHPEREAIETEHGYTTAHYYCDGCGMSFTDAECTNRIPKATAAGYIIHNWSAWSCDPNGHIRTCTCAGCDASQTEAHTGYSEDGVCDVCEYAGTFAETIVFNNSLTAVSEHFTLTAGSIDGNMHSWCGGGDGESITITPKNNDELLIKDIEAVVDYCGYPFEFVGVSSGTKRERGVLSNDSTVHIDDVNAYYFAFEDGAGWAAFREITVYFVFQEHTHTPVLISPKEVTQTKHGNSTPYYHCDSCGRSFSDVECTNELTKETVDSYIIHNWSIQSADAKGHNCTCTCKDCGERSTAHIGYLDDGICDVCGYSGIFAETIVFTGGYTAESEHFILNADAVGVAGWYGGKIREAVTVTAKNTEKLLIRDIEAEISSLGAYYSGVGISGGKKRETGDVSNVATVHIDGVNAASFSFTNGQDVSLFNSITVYFYTSHTYGEILDAKAAIDTAAGANPSKAVRRIADGAKTDIDSAMTVAEVMAIRDGCIADIEKLVHTHTFSSEWSFDETKHWHAPTCGHNDAISEFGDHTFGTDGKCTVCGYEDTGIRAKICTVILTTVDEPDTVLYSGTTDGANICNINNVANGVYLMSVSCEGAVTRTYTTEINDGKVTQEVALYMEGDVNGDGVVDANDYSLAVNTALEADTEVSKDLSEDSDYMKAVADLDCDGVVDVLDMVLLERKIFA